MKIYCITHKPNDNIEKLGLIPVGVGKGNFPKNYIIENSKDNISDKNFCYSETSFHYWIWKNILPSYNDEEWLGTCQYRRYFVKKNFEDKTKNLTHGFLNIKNIDELNLILQKEPANEWNNYDVILCNPYNLSGVKKSKLLKNAFRSILKDPEILFNKKKHTIKLHFEMNHGYGNIEKAANLLPSEDKNDFLDYVSKNTQLNGNCIFLSKNKKLMNDFYKNLFSWLTNCEKVFGFDGNKYGTKRIYSFLTERYMPFWFSKYSKVLAWPWVFFDISKYDS